MSVMTRVMTVWLASRLDEGMFPSRFSVCICMKGHRREAAEEVGKEDGEAIEPTPYIATPEGRSMLRSSQATSGRRGREALG